MTEGEHTPLHQHTTTHSRVRIATPRDTTLDLLTSLVDKSLVILEEHDGATRYRLLETVKQYALDWMAEGREAEAWRDRHLAYFLILAEEAEPHLIGREEQAWQDRLELEHDNLN